jgi:hypothetical protein
MISKQGGVKSLPEPIVCRVDRLFPYHMSGALRKAMGAGNHKMVTAADALWDARGGHDPTVVAATTNTNRSPAAVGRSRATGGARVPVQKVVPLPTRIFSVFKTLAMACASIIIATMQEFIGVR